MMNSNSIKLLLLLWVTLEATLYASAQSTFICGPDPPRVNGTDAGTLIIKQNTTTCGFLTQDSTLFFAIKLDNLQLSKGDQVEITSDHDPTAKKILQPPYNTGYLAIGLKEPKLNFKFAKPVSTTMNIDFLLDRNRIPVNGDQSSEVQILPFRLDKLNVEFAKTGSDLAHLEVANTTTYQHFLIDAASKSIELDITGVDTSIAIKNSVASANCSSNIQDKQESQHEISGPDPKANVPYTCVNLFEAQMSDAHYEVDFSNFVDVVAQDDELIIDNGLDTIKIANYDANKYSKRSIVFNGNHLNVIYKSPRGINQLGKPFKLMVNSKQNGGLVTQAGSLELSPKSNATFVLQPRADEYAVITLPKKAEMPGLNMVITDPDNMNIVTITEDMFLPPKISSNQIGSQTIIQTRLTKDKKVKLDYTPTNSKCGGIISKSGSISISGKQASPCYWIIGSEDSMLSLDYTSLVSGGCVSIYNLKQETPIYSQCNINPAVHLPKFVLGPAYMNVSLTSPDQRLEASITPAIQLYNRIQGIDLEISSSGYPSYYPWSSSTDTFEIDGKNKSVIISVSDLDLRVGESLLVDGIVVDAKKLASFGDIGVSNKVSSIVVKRSSDVSDFKPHRGYKIVATNFDKIIEENLTNHTVTTPGNLSSVLIKISARQGKHLSRLSYKISLTNTSKDYQLNVIDSRTILGSQVEDEEKLQGSSTADTLLVKFVSTKAGTTLPELTVNYTQIACNQTLDHLCDNQSRCVPAEKLCKGRSYCTDGSDLKVSCSAGPAPPPVVIETGMRGIAVFILSVFVFSLGVVSALYGPFVYKHIETRVRGGQYSSFSSVE